MQILEHKMEAVNATGAEIIATANPGCMLQLQAGVRLHGTGQRVMHVVEVFDLAYKNADENFSLSAKIAEEEPETKRNPSRRFHAPPKNQ